METNLHSLFKNSEELELNGVWFMLSETTGFLVRRLGGSNSQKVKAALAKHYKPYTRQIEQGTLDYKKELEIGIKVFVDAALIDWKGVVIDGKEAPFSKEKAIALFMELPDVFNSISEYANSPTNYREDLGNS